MIQNLLATVFSTFSHEVEMTYDLLKVYENFNFVTPHFAVYVLTVKVANFN